MIVLVLGMLLGGAAGITLFWGNGLLSAAIGAQFGAWCGTLVAVGVLYARRRAKNDP
jgi:hypothetical protein